MGRRRGAGDDRVEAREGRAGSAARELDGDAELYEGRQDWQALVESTAAYVQLLPADQKNRAAPLHLKMADIFETKIKNDSRAINALKYALEAQPDNTEALERLAGQDPRKAEVLTLHFFGGLTYDEIASVLAVSAATVDRELRFAKAWVARELGTR